MWHNKWDNKWKRVKLENSNRNRYLPGGHKIKDQDSERYLSITKITEKSNYDIIHLLMLQTTIIEKYKHYYNYFYYHIITISVKLFHEKRIDNLIPSRLDMQIYV